MRVFLTVLAGSVLLAGCSLGPAKLPATCMDYNQAIQRSSNDEMLMNLVRMKFFEQPLFLQVGSVASSFSYNVSAGGSAVIPDQRDFPRSIYSTYAPTFSAQYADSPTVTYTPYQGQTYAQQFLAELDFERLTVLYRSGWDIEYLMRVLVTRMGKLDHSYDARLGFTPDTHVEFLELTRIIAAMDDRGHLDIVTVSPGKDMPNQTVMTMRFADEAEATRVGELLGMDLKWKKTASGHLLAKVRLVPLRDHELSLEHPDKSGMPLMPLRLRNCLRAMDVLSLGITVPADLAAKKAAFDLTSQGKDLCDIGFSSERPPDAYVSVKHGPYWYFIRNEDSRSKEVFQLMLNLFALQSADPPKNAPLLTLPVGAN